MRIRPRHRCSIREVDERLHTSCLLQWQGYLWYGFKYGRCGECAFWNMAGEKKTWSHYADMVQPRIFGFDDTLQCQEVLKDRCVVQDQMGCPELAIYMNEHLGFQNLVQTLMVHKTEVGQSSVFIRETTERNRKTLLANEIYRVDQRKTYIIIQTQT